MSRRLAPAALAVASALVFGACGGGSAEDSSAACHATDTDLNVTARNTSFDTDCLAVVANTAFKIVFENHDPGVPHSIDIYSTNPANDQGATALFDGEPVQGAGRIVYDVPGLPAGTHFFRCEVHPAQMFGTFMVEG